MKPTDNQATIQRSLLVNGIKCYMFARFDWEIQYIENETTRINHDVGPRFLGHLTEDGRAIGFLMERITNARHAALRTLSPARIFFNGRQAI